MAPGPLPLAKFIIVLAPIRAFSLLKVSTSAFILKNILRHYAKRLVKHGITSLHESLSAKIIWDGSLVCIVSA